MSTRTFSSAWRCKEMAILLSWIDIYRRSAGSLGHKVHSKPTHTNFYFSSSSHNHAFIQQACWTFHTGPQGYSSMWSEQPSCVAGVPEGHFQAEQLQQSTDLQGHWSSCEGCSAQWQTWFSCFPPLRWVDFNHTGKVLSWYNQVSWLILVLILKVQPSRQQMFIDLNHTTCFDP
jgi:hypothetical protein